MPQVLHLDSCLEHTLLLEDPVCASLLHMHHLKRSVAINEQVIRSMLGHAQMSVLLALINIAHLLIHGVNSKSNLLELDGG